MLTDEESRIFALSFIIFFFGVCVFCSFLVEYMEIRREFVRGPPRVAPLDTVEVSVDTGPSFQGNPRDVVHIVRGGHVYHIRSSSVYVLPQLNPSNGTDPDAASFDPGAADLFNTGDVEEAFFRLTEPSGPEDTESQPPNASRGFNTSVYMIPLLYPTESINIEAVLSGDLYAQLEARDQTPAPIQLRKAGTQRFVPVTDPVPPRRTTRWSRAALEFRLGNYSMGPCFICCEAQATVVVLNCGHGGMCLKCAQKLWSKEHKCPICRGDYVDMAHILAVSDEGVASALSCTT